MTSGVRTCAVMYPRTHATATMVVTSLGDTRERPERSRLRDNLVSWQRVHRDQTVCLCTPNRFATSAWVAPPYNTPMDLKRASSC